MDERVYIAIDLKSFYASVECVERGLDPLTANLVVADESRTEKTICLAVSPALKSFGIPGRPRLFEVIQRVREVNAERRLRAPNQRLTGESADGSELADHPSLAVSYLVAVPRMALYMAYSRKIYGIYLNYVAPEDIHVYSIDEVFIDATAYLGPAKCTPREFAMRMIQDVLRQTGITATAGIGDNLYLSKVAMDIVAKHIPADKDGVRIAKLNEMSYRRLLWSHRPLTDFWRVGRGYAARLEAHGLVTMGDVARCAIAHEELLYKLFGVNAELLIDHAWGWEPCSIQEIKSYRPESSSLCSGQVLQHAYPADKARMVVREMTDLLSLDLLDKGLMTDQLMVTIGYDAESLTNPEIARHYRGAVTVDHYGRRVPKHAHGTFHLPRPTSSARQLMDAATAIYERVVDPKLLVRHITIGAGHLVDESDLPAPPAEQLDLFIDYEEVERHRVTMAAEQAKERNVRQALLTLRKRYGSNTVLRGVNLEEGATARQRNVQIGGHRA